MSRKSIHRYQVVIYWSAKDNAYLAEIPELKGCVAHGDSHGEALGEVNNMAMEWLATAKENNWQIPEPKGT